MNNILVWGSGFIGSHLKYDKIQERATTEPAHIRATLNAYKPDVIINTIGYCGFKNIDDCLDNKEKTITTNTIIPSVIASECDKLGIHHIIIGSGCIFNGESPQVYDSGYVYDEPGWNESNPANPVSFYSNTKYACDLLVSSLPTTTILRIRMPISSQNNSRNFISKVRNYKQIIDIPNSVSFVDDIARVIEWMAENKKTGIYNVVNPEPLSAADVMKEYQKYVPDHKFDIITGEQLDKITKSKRSNCILDGSKLKNEGFIMRPTQEALEETMKQYVKNIGKDIK